MYCLLSHRGFIWWSIIEKPGRPYHSQMKCHLRKRTLFKESGMTCILEFKHSDFFFWWSNWYIVFIFWQDLSFHFKNDSEILYIWALLSCFWIIKLIRYTLPYMSWFIILLWFKKMLPLTRGLSWESCQSQVIQAVYFQSSTPFCL